MTTLDLAAILAREQAATPGPWRPALVDAVDLGDGEVNGRGGVYPEPRGSAPIFTTNSVTKADLEFMAAARADVPKLIAEVERLRAVLESELERLAPNGQPDVTPVSLVPTVAPAVAWLVAEVERYEPATMGRARCWQHACGHLEWVFSGEHPTAPDEPLHGGCDACESGSNNPDDWQPLYVRRGES